MWQLGECKVYLFGDPLFIMSIRSVRVGCLRVFYTQKLELLTMHIERIPEIESVPFEE